MKLRTARSPVRVPASAAALALRGWLAGMLGAAEGGPAGARPGVAGLGWTFNGTLADDPVALRAHLGGAG